MITETVKSRFQDEFAELRDRFEVIDLALEEVVESQAGNIWNPGTYVFCGKDEVIRIGRSFTNSKKRALEHIRDNTGGTMAALPDNENARLLLFNVKNDEDRHWVAALEVFFEDTLDAKIPAGRRG